MLKRKNIIATLVVTSVISTTGIATFAATPSLSKSGRTIVNQEIQKIESTASITYTGQIAWNHANIELKVLSEPGYEEVMNGKNLKIQGVTLFGKNKAVWNGNGITIQLKDGTKLTKSLLNKLLDTVEYPEGVEKVEVTSISREDVKVSSVRSSSTTFKGGLHSPTIPLPGEEEALIPSRMISSSINPQQNKITLEFDSEIGDGTLELIGGEEILLDAEMRIEDRTKIVIAKNNPNDKFNLSDAPKLVIGGDNPCDVFIENGNGRGIVGNIKLTKVEKDAVSGVEANQIDSKDGVEFIEGKEAKSNAIWFDNGLGKDTKIEIKVIASDEQKEYFNDKNIKIMGDGGTDATAKWSGNTLKVVLGMNGIKGRNSDEVENLINSNLPENIKVDVEFTQGPNKLTPHAMSGESFVNFIGGKNTQFEVKEQLTVGMGLPRTTGRMNVSLTDGENTFDFKVLANVGDNIDTITNKVIDRLNDTDAKEIYNIDKDENGNILITQKDGKGKNVDLYLTVK